MGYDMEVPVEDFLLTPQAAASLFAVSLSAVRKARLVGHVPARLVVHITRKPTNLVSASVAFGFWAPHLDDDARMQRLLGLHTVVIGSAAGDRFLVLHDRPIID